MRRRAIAGAGASALGAATAVAALIMGSATGYAAPGSSEAYGAFISGVVDPPQPLVKSTDGTEQSSSLLELPENPLLAAEVAKVTAGDSKASSQLLGVEVVPGAEAPPELQELLDQIAAGLASVCEQESAPEQLPAELSDLIPPQLGEQLDPAKLCEAFEGGAPALVSIDAVTISCEGNKGKVEIVGLNLLGQEIEIPAEPPANTKPLPENPLINLTFNRQVSEDDMFTVQGVHVDLGGGALEVVLASASCGAPTVEKPPAPTATKPAPVTTGLPVTG